MVRSLRLAAVATSGLVLASCGALQSRGFETAAGLQGPMPGQVEPVYAAAIAHDHAIFWVTSNGCTEKSDLQPIVTASGSDAVIRLRRVRDDRCHRPQPNGLEMRWSFEELGLPAGARLSVENPSQVAPPAV